MHQRFSTRPETNLLCEDVRKAKLDWCRTDHQVLVTSPPYGDNQTTIPYGQFSFLAMRWIPEGDLPGSAVSDLLSNTHALDTASLGGSLRGVVEKESEVRSKSLSFDRFLQEAERAGRRKAVRKVSSFVADFADALRHLGDIPTSTAHWVITTGNRTAGGMLVPFDEICKELVVGLGGKPIAVLRRNLPNKRMPSRNSQGAMITTETTTILEFS